MIQLKVYICRHGETVWNKMGKVQGLSDTPLTDLGVKQAKEVAGILKHVKPAAIYSSSLGRAMQTAEIVAKSHSLKPIPLFELREIEGGKFEGLTLEERRKLYPKEDNERNADKLKVRFPGGENYDDVRKRLAPFVEMIKKKHKNGEIIVVMHQASGRTLMALLTGISEQDFFDSEFKNCMVYVIDTDNNYLGHILDGKEREGVLLKIKKVRV